MIRLQFSIGKDLYKHLLEYREKLLNEYNINDINSITDNLHSYLCLACGYNIFLFMAIEAFVNSQIPNDYLFNIKTKRKTEVYDKTQIQKNLRFDDKIKKILPQITGKSFHLDHQEVFSQILKLKELRDNVVHTKNYKDTFPICYRDLYVELIEFNQERIIYHVKKFINYYDANLIAECDCGLDR